MYWIGFDVGKAFYWVCVLDGEGEVVLSRRVEATEERIEETLSEISELGEPADCVVGIDILGGPATMLEVVLLERGEQVRYVSGTAVNKLREVYAGGENKSDPRDAFVIADQLRMRWRSLPEVAIRREHLAELKVLVGYRRDLVQEQVRRMTRLRAMLAEVFPGMESTLDLRKEGPLLAITKVATPTAARRLGEARLARWLKAQGALKANALAERIVSAARFQKREMPAAKVKAAFVAELASEILRTKARLREFDGRLEGLVEADPSAEVVRSLPGMGLVLTAEFLAEVGDASRFVSADRLAAAAGIVPVLRASGGVSYQRRERKGNRVLKRIFYRSAFSAISCYWPSQAYYRRKRSEGKTAQQTVIALARRRVNVLWAMLRDGTVYEDRSTAAA